MGINDVVVIDVETSNPNLSSICQIGAVKWTNGEKLELSSLINPKTYFSEVNSHIHGISEHDVANAPDFAEFLPIFIDFVGDRIIASYGAFDRSAVNKTLELYEQPLLSNQWLDISTVVRRTWPDKYAQKGYSLKNVTKDLGLKLDNHHDALADSIAAAEVLNIAVSQSNTQTTEWCKILKKRKSRYHIDYPDSGTKAPPPNEDGPLYGEVVVFTGDLSIPRPQAKIAAANAGCEIKSSVSHKTTLIVVGSPNFSLIGDKGKSSKQIRAEELAAQGFPIRFLSESDFMAILDTEN
ncbi:exonuclease domain-containing protein [Vibrio metschnikovii]|uniref:exonuclease domain-containing protein n=1 Tax=Vibrio metschnikovii TaxID=28172 RepID=UPI001302C2C3|nr:exonuclease domain-containing protein [Vibrio metschnikovii]